MQKTALLAIASLVLLLVSGTSFFAVDRTEFAYVTQFGKPIVTYDGATDAGLHIKLPWPIQSVQRIDHRLQVFDLAAAELLTNDPKGKTIDKTLTISAYVCWRIANADGVDQFIRTVGTPDRAEAILGQQISSRLGAEIGTMQLDELISIAPNKEVEERMDDLNQRLLGNGRPDGSKRGTDPSLPKGRSPLSDQGSPGSRESLKENARRAYGIDLVDIRLRRFNYPPQVRDAIFERIRSERNKKAADYQSEGAQLAEDIKSQAEYEARTILADARAAEQRLKGEADAKADQIRNQAQSKDVAFYTFLRKLDEYQRILGDKKTVLLLSSHRDLFDLLFKPPSPENGSSTPKPVPAAVTSKQPAKTGGE
jgi:modulator of FtsH protease HflC